LARKILLADDSVTAQNMGRKILTDAGYDVVTVNNGSAALKRVAELKPDLVVLDVYMPGYSGLEVCARLKDSPDTSRIPILLTVGKLEPFKPEEATRVRPDGFIVKPFEASELLSALTRLEDRMVPSQSDGSRFSTSVSGIERFSGDPMTKKSSGDESDSGWKNRLRFPSKKKKEEPEPEPEPDFVTPSSFREFRRGGGKAPAGSSPFPLSTAPSAAQEPGLVPDIPRDITPEELDALSDLVAKLDGPAAAAEDVTPISDKIGPVEAQAPEAKSEVVAASTPTEVAPTGAIETLPAATTIENSPLSAVETPVRAIAPTVVPEEKAVAQEPAPVDAEPAFASAASATDAAPVAQPEVQVQDAAPSEAVAPAVELQVEPKIETAADQEKLQVEEPPKAAEVPRPAPVVAAPDTTAEGSSPSAEELAEALRFLTPSQTPGSQQTLAEAGAALAHELSHRPASGNGNRWVAEAMAPSAEEVSGSLEDEMFRTFAASAGGQAQSSGATPANSSAGEPGINATQIAAESRRETRSFTPAEESLAAAMAASAAASVRAEAQQKDSPAKAGEENPVTEEAAVTFADAVRRDETESVSALGHTVNNVSAEPLADEEDSISENGPGGQEAMGKETKGKGGKWHQIRSGVPAASDAVEAAKQSEENPKTMAAAASADGADPNSIASIVDSVLADLRPRIVEEIAKKLAKK
jgi:CheY-like chemotaxis protein